MVHPVLLGQPELDAKLDGDELRQLRQRVSVRWCLDPLPVNDTGLYVKHRLQIAAGAPRDIFTSAALREILADHCDINLDGLRPDDRLWEDLRIDLEADPEFFAQLDERFGSDLAGPYLARLTRSSAPTAMRPGHSWRSPRPPTGSRPTRRRSRVRIPCTSTSTTCA